MQTGGPKGRIFFHKIAQNGWKTILQRLEGGWAAATLWGYPSPCKHRKSTSLWFQTILADSLPAKCEQWGALPGPRPQQSSNDVSALIRQSAIVKTGGPVVAAPDLACGLGG